MELEIYQDKPSHFSAELEVAACYIEHEGKLLLLKNNEKKGNKWTVPAGKLEPGETLFDGMQRELFEETRIQAEQFTHFQTVYAIEGDLHFTYHMFSLSDYQGEPVKLSDEHEAFDWVPLEEVPSHSLMPGAVQMYPYFLLHRHNEPFYYVRHGQTEHNVKNIIDDSTDISINAHGVLQAKTIEPLIASLPIQSICHSPAKRVLETKDLVSKKHVVEEHLIEELGEYTGKIWFEMINKKPRSKETLQFIERVKQGLVKALSKPGPTLIVSHGGVHFVISYLLKTDHKWIIDNCEPVLFEPGEHEWRASLLQT